MIIMKPKVAILISGQMRSNSLGSLDVTDDTILNSINNNFINHTFKAKYEYDIFFSVDVINQTKVNIAFGENVKNINITETGYCLNPIQQNIPAYNHFEEKYLKTEFNGNDTHLQALYQYYRLYTCYNMAKNFENNNRKYDYFVRIRPDVIVTQDINILFNILETTSFKIITEHEQIIICKSEMEDIFKFIDYYGYFTDNVSEINAIEHSLLFRHYFRGYKKDITDSNKLYNFCPETQIVRYINLIIKSKDLDFENTFFGITYPSFNLIYRGNGVYGYYYDTSGIFKPYDSI